jgi:ribosomal protein S12 methylthiotransferase accessory factor YcaO
MNLARDVGLEPLLLDITSELGVPTCLCALVRPDGGHPYVSMGASCRLDGEAAIHDAILEAASVHHILAEPREPLRLPADYVPWSDPSLHTRERLAFWANPEHAGHLAAFLDGPTHSVTDFCRGSRADDDARSNLARLTDLLRRHSLDAWYVEARHPALDALGYASVRVICPDLVPMYCQEQNAPLGLPRLRNDGAGQPTFPPWPHPFP